MPLTLDHYALACSDCLLMSANGCDVCGPYSDPSDPAHLATVCDARAVALVGYVPACPSDCHAAPDDNGEGSGDPCDEFSRSACDVCARIPGTDGHLAGSRHHLAYLRDDDGSPIAR